MSPKWLSASIFNALCREEPECFHSQPSLSFSSLPIPSKLAAKQEKKKKKKLHYQRTLGGFLALPLQLKCFLTLTGNKVELSRFHLAEKKKDFERFDLFQVDTQQITPHTPTECRFMRPETAHRQEGPTHHICGCVLSKKSKETFEFCMNTGL